MPPKGKPVAKRMLKKCQQCGTTNAGGDEDTHDRCLACLGMHHNVATCVHCQHLNARTRQQRVRHLRVWRLVGGPYMPQAAIKRLIAQDPAVARALKDGPVPDDLRSLASVRSGPSLGASLVQQPAAQEGQQSTSAKASAFKAPQEPSGSAPRPTFPLPGNLLPLQLDVSTEEVPEFRVKVLPLSDSGTSTQPPDAVSEVTVETSSGESLQVLVTGLDPDPLQGAVSSGAVTTASVVTPVTSVPSTMVTSTMLAQGLLASALPVAPGSSPPWMRETREQAAAFHKQQQDAIERRLAAQDQTLQQVLASLRQVVDAQVQDRRSGEGADPSGLVQQQPVVDLVTPEFDRSPTGGPEGVPPSSDREEDPAGDQDVIDLLSPEGDRSLEAMSGPFALVEERSRQERCISVASPEQVREVGDTVGRAWSRPEAAESSFMPSPSDYLRYVRKVAEGPPCLTWESVGPKTPDLCRMDPDTWAAVAPTREPDDLLVRFLKPSNRVKLNPRTGREPWPVLTNPGDAARASSAVAARRVTAHTQRLISGPAAALSSAALDVQGLLALKPWGGEGPPEGTALTVEAVSAELADTVQGVRETAAQVSDALSYAQTFLAQAFEVQTRLADFYVHQERKAWLEGLPLEPELRRTLMALPVELAKPMPEGRVKTPPLFGQGFNPAMVADKEARKTRDDLAPMAQSSSSSGKRPAAQQPKQRAKKQKFSSPPPPTRVQSPPQASHQAHKKQGQQGKGGQKPQSPPYVKKGTRGRKGPKKGV
jgi:hypothetical protein